MSRSSLSAVADGAPPAAASAGPIRTLLIANRGEIAARVARTAHRLGMRVIGIHAPDDRPAAGTDEAHEVPGYLDGEAILAVAERARGRWGPSRLRVPRREPGVCAQGRPRPASAGSGRRPRRSPRWATRPRLAGARPPTASRRFPATTARRRTTRRWPPRPSASATRCSSSPAPAAAGRACASSASLAS